MSKPPWRVFVCRRLPQAGLDLLARPEIQLDVFEPDRAPTREELHAAARGRHALLALAVDRVDAALLDAAGPQLRIVANYAVGFDNVDVTEATRRGVFVTNTPDVLTDATADLTFALLLAAARRIGEGERMVRRGDWAGWRPLELLGADVFGATLGIVGAGRIGTAVARRAAGFNMRILYTKRSPNAELDAAGAQRVELPELLRESDFVSLHCNLNESTQHLVGAAELAAMKPTAYLINTTRGAVVDEAALVEALRTRRIAGAGLDVYEREPRISSGLLGLENVVLLPHLGSATQRTREKMAIVAAKNILAALRGERPPNLVNPEVR